MNLFLHIGTEKTGSSYLQQTCGINRDFLLEKGFYFPDAGRDEQRLLAGSISPGNARELTDLIRSKEWDQVSKWLSSRVNAAQASGSEQLLLSNENLVAAFAENGQVEAFEAAAAQSGIRCINALLLIRDPVDHAISLYKHRAKNGKIESLSKWIRNEYSLPSQLEGFISQVDVCEIGLNFRKYSREPGQIEKVFFEDWLGLQKLPHKLNGLVNPSLTLSELKLIRYVALRNRKAVPLFYKAMLAVPVEQKAADHQLETYAWETVESHISNYNQIWESLSVRLAFDGGIEVPVTRAAPCPLRMTFCFSESQLASIVDAHNESQSFRYQIATWLREIFRLFYR